MFKVFMDESGVHDTSPIVTVAAYIGTPKAWRAWTKEWVRALRPIKVYHAVDAQNRRGEFADWTDEQVGELAARLLPVIANVEIAAVSIGMDLRAYESALAGREDLRALFGTPYVACFQWAIQVILNLAKERNNTDRFAFIHEVNEYHGAAMSAFNYVRQNSNLGGNAISLTLAGKNDFPPLQAADILAYETNKRLRNIDAAPRRPWAALRANTFAAHYGESNMGELVSALDKIKSGNADEISRGMGWNRSWA